jgi:hypothetical protein
MYQSSMAIFRAPRVETFEAHERDDLKAATIYVAIAAAIAGILGAIAFRMNPPDLRQATEDLEQMGEMGGRIADAMSRSAAATSLPGAAISGVLGTLFGFFVFLGLTYVIGRMFGGTGAFGELAYDIALFYAPLQVLGAILQVISIGPLACLTFLSGIGIFAFQIYLNYVGIQSGMNLPKDKALWVVIILFVLGLIVAVMVAAIIAAIVAAIVVAGAA